MATTIASAIAAVLTATLLASYSPARRAARTSITRHSLTPTFITPSLRLLTGLFFPLMRRLRVVMVVGMIALSAGTWRAFRTPAGPASLRNFNPDRLADLELRMWRSYYAKERVNLFRLLVIMLREQYHYSWATAVSEAFHLARAAATFGDATSNYESVLPDLETAYTTARMRLNAGFDPAAVARAELAWWVARRVPGQNSAERVGELMAQEYALLYEVPKPLIARSALLRAQAGKLRDDTAAQPDWETVQTLLLQSFRELRTALDRNGPR